MELDVMGAKSERQETGKAESNIAIGIKSHKTARKMIVKYTPLAFIVILIAVALIFVVTYNNWKKFEYNTNKIQNESLMACLTDSECPAGQICKEVSAIGENSVLPYKTCMNE